MGSFGFTAGSVISLIGWSGWQRPVRRSAARPSMRWSVGVFFGESIIIRFGWCAMSELSALREYVLESAGYQCEWPGCTIRDGLQLAHLNHRGMGGFAAANVPANCACLCTYHHDVLDGRTVKGRRFEVTALLKAYQDGRRKDDDAIR